MLKANISDECRKFIQDTIELIKFLKFQFSYFHLRITSDYY